MGKSRICCYFRWIMVTRQLNDDEILAVLESAFRFFVCETEREFSRIRFHFVVKCLDGSVVIEFPPLGSLWYEFNLFRVDIVLNDFIGEWRAEIEQRGEKLDPWS